MKTKMKTFVSVIVILCLLAAFLSGCGSTQIAEASGSATASQQENRQEQSQNQKDNKKMDAPEMEKIEIPEEDIAALLQAGMNAVAEESDLWTISEITDAEVLMQLTQSRGGKERSEGEGREAPEDMTPPDREGEQLPDGEMPEGAMPERSGENRPENMEGSFPDGEKPEGGQGRGEAGGRQHGGRGSGMSGLAIVISGTEDATLSTEDIFTQIQLAAEELGYQASSMELTEEQQSVIEVPDGYSVKMVILINTQMPEMEAGEAVG